MFEIRSLGQSCRTLDGGSVTAAVAARDRAKGEMTGAAESSFYQMANDTVWKGAD